MEIIMKNPVAKHAHKFNRAVVEDSKKAYKRKEKHTKTLGGEPCQKPF